ncbi:MAG: glucose-1-phosphate thymidylyltransferase RfbA [Alphaproteobacteria bacterium]|nr:glucose-1-phosphate thymidylyltransferase RfbA [Alphaproteobacteria bacterium]MBU1512959.1 glucose-1-phosphate thymidylyltransferase RfbA [Alphaproteobacteria bacterium]MBU2094867.1 glucose-1-phosphate thymidylyltransferase RfbA [Alphaproteobacteria bacterium]MBU2152773.1 glucose-1-phosphate thymidylyltransferase RfbA [Alphaproteobacteria bacterium]MBU2306318.1 glucose-1-phosphate thymidylyltransferase RfbA [Alphaproteobacteria bacterium]
MRPQGTRRGIVLAGGAGTRLHPLTIAVSKQLLPVYDKPMIYYPLSVLFLAGIREILIITTEEDQAGFKRLLGDGSRFGVKFEYVIQPTPGGLAEAYLLGEEFVGGEPSTLILGDNIFFGQNFRKMLKAADARKDGATVFGYPVHDPERYGVVELSPDNKALSIEEKPAKPKSNYAVTGLYFYDGRASEIAKTLSRSARGELEITALNDVYLQEGNLHVELLGRGFAWEDAGTHDSLIGAGELIRVFEQRQGLRIGCLEEIAFENGWIDKSELMKSAEFQGKSEYGKYLRELAADAK